MAIPNIVPRANDDGETLGKSTKQWSNVYTKDLTVNGSSLTTLIAGKADSSTVSTHTAQLAGTADSALKEQIAQKLDLSGGTMTNGIVLSGDAVSFASRADSTKSLTMEAGVKGNATGGYIILNGKDFQSDTTLQGIFSLGARKDGNTLHQLVGYPDGRLQWVNDTSSKDVAFKRYLSIPAPATKTAVGGIGTASVDGFVYVEGVTQDTGAGSCWLIVDNVYQVGNAQYYGANLISMFVPIRAGGSWAVNHTGLKDLKLWFFSARSEV